MREAGWGVCRRDGEGREQLQFLRKSGEPLCSEQRLHFKVQPGISGKRKAPSLGRAEQVPVFARGSAGFLQLRIAEN
jgi:hypothetical protein